MPQDYFDKLISRLELLDPKNIRSYVLRLVREKGFLETVFDAIREGIVVIDMHLQIQYANKAAVELLGIPENVKEQRVSKFFREVEWQRIFVEDRDEWYRISRQEVEVFYPKHRVLDFYLVPHAAEKGTATIIFNDITESRLKEKKHLESEKVEIISLLAAGVAHEIGNPLNSLNIHLQLLERHLIDRPDPEASELLDVAKREVERLHTIVSQFLKAVRPAPPELVDVCLKDVALETLDFMGEELRARGVRNSCRWPEYLPPVKGDANQLKQMLYNLVKNAAQAMSCGGELEIRIELESDFISLSVSDTGAGIGAEDRARIFDPYYSSKRKKGGAGLGLMIVERIVREHGAELSLESVPGKGTVFSVHFPLRRRRLRLLGPPPGDKDRDSSTD